MEDAAWPVPDAMLSSLFADSSLVFATNGRLKRGSKLGADRPARHGRSHVNASEAAVDKKELGAPASGSLIYMLSKEAYLTDQPPHNLDHLMYDLPRLDGAAWGANLPGAPIYFQQLNPAPITEFYVVMVTGQTERP